MSYIFATADGLEPMLAFNFIDIVGFPLETTEQPVLEMRAGVDGHALWKTGKRGDPFTVTTWRDCIDIGDAALAAQNYRVARSRSIAIQWAGLIFTTKFDVLDVRPVDRGVESIILGVGGVLGVSNALCIAQWHLIATNSFLE